MAPSLRTAGPQPKVNASGRRRWGSTGPTATTGGRVLPALASVLLGRCSARACQHNFIADSSLSLPVRVLRNVSGSPASPAQPPGSITRYPRYRPEIQKFGPSGTSSHRLRAAEYPRGRITFSYTSAIPISSAGMVLSTGQWMPTGQLGELLDQRRCHQPPSIRP
jgi:hypothetical protein